MPANVAIDHSIGDTSHIHAAGHQWQHRWLFVLVALVCACATTAAIRPHTATASAECILSVTGPAAGPHLTRICAALSMAAADLHLIDAVHVAGAGGDGMRWPVNPEANNAINCGEAPRGARVIVVRDHPACLLGLYAEHMVLHELGHKVWEARYGEPYGPRWQEEEAFAEQYAANHGYAW